MSVLTRGLCNPVIRKMRKKTDELAGYSPKVTTYGGIARKTTYFLILAVVGVVAYFVAHPYVLAQAGKDQIVDIAAQNGIFHFHFALYEGIAFAVCAFISLFLPLIAWGIRATIPVVGTLYALCQGYMIGFITGNIGSEYQWIGIAALAATLILLFVMLILYTTRIARPSRKFVSIISSFFFACLIIGALGFVLYIIPFTRPYMSMVDAFMAKPEISIGISVLCIFVATLFLLVDFNVIESCVEDRMPRKLEWMAAWGLSYT
ncbi:MAG: Bax inhibitor-1/YccA family protein, partial [Firmicutes bacterium]|nr:Bax inhibitor-1/YccA family protein [Bacillota bacterium]